MLAATRSFMLLGLSVTVLFGLGMPATAQVEGLPDTIETSGVRLMTPQTKQAIERGLAYLASRQHPDGSFGTPSRPMYRANTGITGLCGIAFLADGHTPGRGKYGENVQRTLEFLLSKAQPTGLISNPASASYGPMYDHGFAVLFLAEVYGMTEGQRSGQTRERLKRVLNQAVSLIVDSQNREGGWRYQPDGEEADLSVTVAQVMALRACKNSGIYVPKTTIDRSVEYVRKSQNADGGFRYQLTRQRNSEFARSAAGVVALHSAGIYKGDEIAKGLAYVRRYKPRPGLFPPPRYYYYGQYYAVQAMWHAGGNAWREWYPAVRDDLLRQQQATGGWVDSSVCSEYSTAMALIVLQMPNQLLPIFQR